jgi:hypothetical protein
MGKNAEIKRLYFSGSGMKLNVDKNSIAEDDINGLCYADFPSPNPFPRCLAPNSHLSLRNSLSEALRFFNVFWLKPISSLY